MNQVIANIEKKAISSFSIRRCRKILFTCIAVISSLKVTAAPFEETEYRTLIKQADQQKFVSVLVGLDVDASLPNFVQRPAQTRALIGRAEKALLKELGNDVADTAISSSGLGQMSLYVNKKGLEKLLKSDNVRRVMPDAGRSEIYEDQKQLSKMHDTVQRDDR